MPLKHSYDDRDYINYKELYELLSMDSISIDRVMYSFKQLCHWEYKIYHSIDITAGIHKDFMGYYDEVFYLELCPLQRDNGENYCGRSFSSFSRHDKEAMADKIEFYNKTLTIIEDKVKLPIEEFTQGAFSYITENSAQ